MTTRSIWNPPDSSPPRRIYSGDAEVDAVVIGAGITGLTTAVLLIRQGKRVWVLDAAAEQQWDCPCHGSIFESSGELSAGPATSGLASRPSD